MKKRAILLVHFGTSHLDTKEKTLDIIKEEIEKTFPGVPVYEAWTSKIILRILARRNHLIIPNISEVMEIINRDRIEELIVQPTHIINGYENDAMKELVLQGQGEIKNIVFGDPLLTSEDDYVRVMRGIMEAVNCDSDQAVVWMGHGTAHHINEVYEHMNVVLRELGYENGFVGTVEAEPSIKTLVQRITTAGYRNATVLPLMTVAGDHAKNDMAGDEDDSWKNQLTAAGCQTECILQGLGEYPCVRSLFIEHAKHAMEVMDRG